MNKLSALLTICLFAFCGASAETLNWAWAKGAGSTDADSARSVATDPFGNVYVVGVFNGPSITFGSTTLTQAGGGDMYIVKYDETGHVRWAAAAGGINADDARGVATDAAGNVVVVGGFSSPTITFGSTILLNSGGSDLYVVKYDSAGAVQWAKSTGGSGEEAAQAVSVDATGNAFVTGWFNSVSLPFGFSTLSTSGDYDVFLAKYDSYGNTLWAVNGIGAGYDAAYSVKADNKGAVYVAGLYASATLAFGTNTFTNIGGYDMFLIKYDTLGNVMWGSAAGNVGDEEAQSVTTDADGNVYLVGNFTSANINFGTFAFTNAGQKDVFVIRYTPGGSIIWIRKVGSAGSDEAFNVTTDAAGDVYIAGGFNSSTLTVGGMTLTNTALGTKDIFLAKYDPAGNGLWSKNAGGADNDVCYSLAVSAPNNIYICGKTTSTSLVFGALPAIGNVGSTDAFTAQLRITTAVQNHAPNIIGLYPNPATTSIEVVAPQPVTAYTVYDFLGRELLSSKLSAPGNQFTIKLPQLADGMYMLQLEGDNTIERHLFNVAH